MTTGRPLSLLIRFSLPLLIGNLFQQAYNLADSVIVGRLIGANALAAVGSTASVTFLFFSVCNGICSGSGIVTAQFFGAGNDERVKRSISNSAYIMLVTSLIMGTVAFSASAFVMGILKTPPEIIDNAVMYIRMMSIGVPLVGVYNYSASMLRALGDSKTPLYFLVVSCVINVGMDITFVSAFGMGVFGAALATIISQLISGVGCLIFAVRKNHYFRLKRADLAFDPGIVIRAVKIGIPLALQWSLIAVSTTALQRFVNTFGAAAVAAFTATSRVEQLVQQPYGSLSLALSTYAGQNYGADRIDRIRKGLNESMIVILVFSGIMFLVMQLLSGQIIGIFINEADVVELGGKALRLTSCFYLFLGLIYVTRGIQNGIGDSLFALINGIVEVSCRIILPLIFVLIPGLGVWGIWLTAGCTWCISAIFCLIRYFSWKGRKNDKSSSHN